MIALRPIYGRFGPMKVTILEGRTIPKQILKLLNVKQLLKDGVIGDSPVKKKESEKDTDK